MILKHDRNTYATNKTVNYNTVNLSNIGYMNNTIKCLSSDIYL